MLTVRHAALCARAARKDRNLRVCWGYPYQYVKNARREARRMHKTGIVARAVRVLDTRGRVVYYVLAYLPTYARRSA